MVNKRTRLFIKLFRQSNLLKDCSTCAKISLGVIGVLICLPLIFFICLIFSSILTKYTPLHVDEYVNYTNSLETLECNVSITDITNKKFGCNLNGLPYVIILLIYITIIAFASDSWEKNKIEALIIIIILSIIFTALHNFSHISYYVIKNFNDDCYFDSSKQIYSMQCRQSFGAFLGLFLIFLICIGMCGLLIFLFCSEEDSLFRYLYKRVKEDINTIDVEMNKINL